MDTFEFDCIIYDLMCEENYNSLIKFLEDNPDIVNNNSNYNSFIVMIFHDLLVKSKDDLKYLEISEKLLIYKSFFDNIYHDCINKYVDTILRYSITYDVTILMEYYNICFKFLDKYNFIDYNIEDTTNIVFQKLIDYALYMMETTYLSFLEKLLEYPHIFSINDYNNCRCKFFMGGISFLYAYREYDLLLEFIESVKWEDKCSPIFLFFCDIERIVNDAKTNWTLFKVAETLFNYKSLFNDALYKCKGNLYYDFYKKIIKFLPICIGKDLTYRVFSLTPMHDAFHISENVKKYGLNF